ncbi:MAG: RidA family protein [Acidobacteriota bacterium]
MTQRETIIPDGMNYNPESPYSPGVKVRSGTLLFVSGQTARDASGQTVGIGDIRVQARQIMENIGRILAQGGAGFQDIVKITMFLADRRDLPAAIEVRSEYLKGNKPASTAVQAVLRPDALIEIEAIAVIREEPWEDR